MTNNWPYLSYEALKGTISTVQLWTQIIGKVRLVKMPWINHSWHVTLYVSPTGLTTGSIPFEDGLFQLDFNFINHKLLLSTSSGKEESMNLDASSVSDFYKEFKAKLNGLNIHANIYSRPNEIDPAIPFEQNTEPREYNPEQMHNLWLAWVNIHKVFNKFRAKFSGKCSPVHFFWGGFDLAVTRFSGRKAPDHPGGAPNMPLIVMQEAYSHEVSSCGFWPGSEASPYPVFYSYCYPTPDSFGKVKVEPEEAFYSEEMGEFFLSYDIVRKSNNPEKCLMQFLQSTYEAAATSGAWNRAELETDYSRFEKKL